MPINQAIGKTVTVVHPAAGTIKSSSGLTALSATGVHLTKQTSTASSAKIEKQEEADPAEIIAVADFNRVFDSSKSKTPYGEYYNALDVVHSTTTDDVVYVVNTALEKDTSSQWSTLRDNVEADAADAADFNEDLANVSIAIEQACKSLNFLRLDDDDLQEEAEKFLDGRLKPYSTPAASRTLNVNSFLTSDVTGTPASELYSSSGGGIEALKETLSNIASEITVPPDNSCFYDLGQVQSTKDLNPTSPTGVAWNCIDSMNAFNTNPSTRLTNASKMLSYVLGVSAGIRKVEKDPIASRVSFSSSNLGAIFEGTKSSSSIPYRRSKGSSNYGSNLIALSLMQFSTSDGQLTIPVESEDSQAKKYKSGINSLIRNPISNGDYKFSDFSSFAGSFEDSRLDVENYSEMMLGYLDSDNELTPSGVLRIIASNFIDALMAAKSGESSRYQLVYTSIAGNATSTDSRMMRQRLLQIAGRIKYYQLKRGESSTGSGDDAAKKTTLVTTLVSSGSLSLQSDAFPTTTQTQDKSDAATDRVIARTASASPASDKLALSMVTAVYNNALLGGPTAATLQKLIDVAQSELKDLEDDANTANLRFSSTGQYYYYNEYQEDLKKIENKKNHISELKTQLAVTPDYNDTPTVISYFEEAMKTTDGTFWSCMVKAYDDIVDAALKRLPENVKITDELGKTAHGAFDEFGLLSLIVDCFVTLSAPMKLLLQKSEEGSNVPTFDENFEASVNVEQLAADVENALRNLLPSITIVGFSSANVSSYIDELTLLTSSKNPEELSNLKFNLASSVKISLDSLRVKVERYQNAMAYLNAFSTVMTRSKDDIVAAFSDILGTSARRAALDNPQGRQMMSSLTNQQMVYRRSLLDKYASSSASGYLPARFAYSENESAALQDLISSSQYSSKLSENTRIVVAGLPAGTIDSSKKYNDPDLGTQSYTGLIELVLHRRDHELDDLIFKEKIVLFDPQLYVTPDSFVSYTRSRGETNVDPALQIAKKLTFKLYTHDGSKSLAYGDFASEERYQNLTKFQINEIIKNATLSYLLETYLFKTTGMVFDESITLNLNDSISDAGRSALTAVSAQNLPNLVLPNSQQLNSLFNSGGEVDFFADIPNMSTGDRELISALRSSYIMRSEKPIDRLIANCGFDRVFIVAVDPDSFVIDKSETVSKNGNAGKQMLSSMQKQGLLIQDKSDYKIIPRDPMTGGFSIGDFSCQFVPHTASTTPGSLLKVAADVVKAASLKVGSQSSKKTSSKLSSKTTKISKTPSKTSKGVKL